MYLSVLTVTPAKVREAKNAFDKLYWSANAHVHMDKVAAAPKSVLALAGRLVGTKSGWIVLDVPMALVRGAFDALHEPGVELPPPFSDYEDYKAHISVMRPEELKDIGGIDKITERGHHFKYTLGPIKSVEPASWGEMSKVWFIQVKSPELQKLRKTYGLSGKPNDGEFEFHITFAVRRKNVLHENDVSKAAEDIQPPAFNPEIAIDRPKGYKKTFLTSGGKKELIYPLDYGYFKGVVNPQDQEEADVFTGSGGPHYGRFMKGNMTTGTWQPDEHKWYHGLNDEELKLLHDWWATAHDKDLIRDWTPFQDRAALLADLQGLQQPVAKTAATGGSGATEGASNGSVQGPSFSSAPASAEDDHEEAEVSHIPAQPHFPAQEKQHLPESEADLEALGQGVTTFYSNKEAALLGHIGGVSGAGKTTLLDQLAQTHPGLVTKDVDEFDWAAKQHLGFDKEKGPPQNWADEKLQQLGAKKQELSDAFLQQHAAKPVVYSGIHNDESGFNVPTANKFMIDTWPLTATYRAWKRNRGTDYAIKPSGLWRYWMDNRKLWRKYEEQGYTPTSSADIATKVQQLVADHSKTAAEYVPHVKEAAEKHAFSARLIADVANRGMRSGATPGRMKKFLGNVQAWAPGALERHSNDMANLTKQYPLALQGSSVENAAAINRAVPKARLSELNILPSNDSKAHIEQSGGKRKIYTTPSALTAGHEVGHALGQTKGVPGVASSSREGTNRRIIVNEYLANRNMRENAAKLTPVLGALPEGDKFREWQHMQQGRYDIQHLQQNLKLNAKNIANRQLGVNTPEAAKEFAPFMRPMMRELQIQLTSL